LLELDIMCIVVQSLLDHAYQDY